ncbi:MAG: toll/interleukin-1 receptor domain-containing protein [Acidobacteriota bacterium]|nr:toll/interleukin-1 receptor domain-containing protein [Acidobacteriota bacterium]
MVKLFFSYSHRDETLRNELQTHLSSLQRQGVIESWHDRRIGAGKEINNEINKHLEEAQIILLLISPYFIASDYCYEIEMKRAMEKHEAGEARVIPVILEPSNWHKLPFGKLLAVPTDGKAVSKFPNLHDAFLEITLTIEKAAKEFNNAATIQNTPQSLDRTEISQPQIVSQIRSSNLRVKKTFTDLEKNTFQNKAFEYIANFFEGSLKELASRNPEVGFDFRRVDANHFTATAYLNGYEASSCSIGFNDDRLFNGITYSQGKSLNRGINDSLSVDDDGYNMFLKSWGVFSRSSKDNQNLSFEGAAEFFWERFIQPLQQ